MPDSAFLSVLLQLQERVNKDLRVGAIGVVTSVGDAYSVEGDYYYNLEVDVTLFGATQEEGEKNISCVWADKEELTSGDIVVVLFTDRNVTVNLKQTLNGTPRSQRSQIGSLHAEGNGIILKKIGHIK